MIYTIIVVISLIIIMIIIMFLILKKSVRIVNEQAKNYFISKLQDYDDLIDKKEAYLKELNDEIKKSNDNQNDDSLITVRKPTYYYNEKVPDYQDKNMQKIIKMIDKEFDFNHEKIVRSFISKVKRVESDKLFYLYKGLKEKLNFDVFYELSTCQIDEQLEILNKIINNREKKIVSEYLKTNDELFDLNDFTTYLDDIITKINPTVYVIVGRKNENYDYIDNHIKTLYDENILRGISIRYKNKVYDYTL